MWASWVGAVRRSHFAPLCTAGTERQCWHDGLNLKQCFKRIDAALLMCKLHGFTSSYSYEPSLLQPRVEHLMASMCAWWCQRNCRILYLLHGHGRLPIRAAVSLEGVRQVPTLFLFSCNCVAVYGDSYERQYVVSVVYVATDLACCS